MRSNRLKTIIITFLIIAFISGLVREIRSKYIVEEDAYDTTTQTEAEADYYTYGEVEDVVKYLGNTKERESLLIRLVDPLNKSQFIDAKYLYDICEVTSIDPEFFCKNFETRDKTDKVTKEEFDEFYDTVVKSKKINGVKKKSIFVYDIIKEDKVSIFDGNKTYALEYNINEEYKDTIIDVYARGDAVYKILGFSDDTCTLNNVLIEEITGNNCYFLYKNLEKNIPLDLNNEADAIHSYTDAHSKTDAITGIKPFVASIEISNSGVKKIIPYEKVVNEKVLDVSDNNIRVANMGNVKLSKDFMLYDIYEQPFCEDNISVMLGHKSIELSIDKDNCARAGIIHDDIDCEKIRVLLTNTVLNSYDFTEIRLSCDEDYRVTLPDGERKSFKANDPFDVLYEDYEIGDEFTVEPDNTKGKISVYSIKRDCGVPQYSGIFKIYICENGINIVNELPFEKYLYSVVSNMLPKDSPMEADMAMAICARGYAYAKVLEGSYADYNADVDDSSACQMYGNLAVSKAAIDAVKNTYGIVATYKGNLIIPYYYSTSCGTMRGNEEDIETEDNQDVYPFYVDAYENEKKTAVDLSKEEDFAKFIMNIDESIIEKNAPYYRWNVSFEAKELSKNVNMFLENNQEELVECCSQVDEEGNYLSDDIIDIGEIEDISVATRSKCGAIESVLVTGSKKTIRIDNANVVRTMFSPEKHDIIKNDGTTSSAWSNLPSPYFYIEKSEGKFTVFGGGLGSGIGLSINGACCLANSGYNYKYILRYFFPYTDFMSIYDIQSVLQEEE